MLTRRYDAKYLYSNVLVRAKRLSKIMGAENLDNDDRDDLLAANCYAAAAECATDPIWLVNALLVDPNFLHHQVWIDGDAEHQYSSSIGEEFRAQLARMIVETLQHDFLRIMRRQNLTPAESELLLEVGHVDFPALSTSSEFSFDLVGKRALDHFSEDLDQMLEEEGSCSVEQLDALRYSAAAAAIGQDIIYRYVINAILQVPGILYRDAANTLIAAIEGHVANQAIGIGFGAEVRDRDDARHEMRGRVVGYR